MPSTDLSRPLPLRSGVLLGIVAAAALAVSGCGSEPASGSPAAPTAAPPPASAPVAPGTVQSCLGNGGVSLTDVKSAADGARFGAQLEVQLDPYPGADSIGVFVYPDVAAAGRAQSTLVAEGGTGVEVVNNSVLAGTAGQTPPEAAPGIATVRRCVTTGA